MTALSRETPNSTPAPSPSAGRMLSVDALRGFDMLWIVGASGLVAALDKWTQFVPLRWLRSQLTHKDWAGFHCYDLIFPLFIFITGVSTVFSLDKLAEARGRAVAARRVILRGVGLFIAGLVYSGGLTHPWPELRVMGVLNRIALSYTGAGLLYLFTPRRFLAAAATALLLGYWGMLAFMPIRDLRLDANTMKQWQIRIGQPDARLAFASVTNYVTGKYEPGYNVVNHFDFEHLPGKLYDGFYDPEGILSTIPAIASCLLGVLAGLTLTSPGPTGSARTVRLMITGFGLIVAGLVWDMEFPIIKKIWTSSFVCLTAGLSFALLGVFHQVVDVWDQTGWTQPLIWVGSNPLAIYFGAQILSYRKVAERFVGGDIREAAGPAGDALVAAVSLAVLLCLAHFLHRRRVFLRL